LFCFYGMNIWSMDSHGSCKGGHGNQQKAVEFILKLLVT
jgi:hypothetical protein